MASGNAALAFSSKQQCETLAAFMRMRGRLSSDGPIRMPDL